MAASRPIVAAVHGELAALIDTADCGWVVSPGDPDALARVCLELASTDASVLRRKGANGREFVERHYRRSHLADRALAAATSTVPAPSGLDASLLARTMTSPALAHDAALVTLDRGVDRSGPVISLDKTQRTVFVMVIAAIVTAVAAPYPTDENHPRGHAGAVLGDAPLQFRRAFRRSLRPAPADVRAGAARDARHTGVELADGFPGDFSRRGRQHGGTAVTVRRLRLDAVLLGRSHSGGSACVARAAASRLADADGGQELVVSVFALRSRPQAGSESSAALVPDPLRRRRQLRAVAAWPARWADDRQSADQQTDGAVDGAGQSLCRISRHARAAVAVRLEDRRARTRRARCF